MSRSKVKVTMLKKRDFFQGFFVISLRFDLEVKGHMGQGQRSRGSRSNKGSKERQVGSRQRQVASLIKHCGLGQHHSEPVGPLLTFCHQKSHIMNLRCFEWM